MKDQYAVIQHSSGLQGGYVVRTVTNGYLAAPYRLADAIKVYTQRSAAESKADKLTFG